MPTALFFFFRSLFCLVGIKNYLRFFSTLPLESALLCSCEASRFASQIQIQMKYTISSTDTRSKLAQAYVAILAPGKAGEILVKQGFSQATFAEFLAIYATRAIAAKFTTEQLADAFRAIGAGNASQVSQALADLSITLEGEKPQSLSAYWGSGKAKPDLSRVSAF